ncbi:MAG: hypothetical protein ABWZ40_10700 [Caulobacterales bacterium]
MRNPKQPLQQSSLYARAVTNSRLAMWLDVTTAALIFYIFT